jgi:hypothetical protein
MAQGLIIDSGRQFATAALTFVQSKVKEMTTELEAALI